MDNTFAPQMPVLVDNRNKTATEALTEMVHKGDYLDIATSCLSIYAFEKIRQLLSKSKKIRLLLTSPLLNNAGAGTLWGIRGTAEERRSVNPLMQSVLAREMAALLQQKANIRASSIENPNAAIVVARKSGEKPKLLPDDQSTLPLSIDQSALFPGPEWTLGGLGITASVKNYMGQCQKGAIAASYLPFFEQNWESGIDVKAQMLELLTQIAKDRAPSEIYEFAVYHLFKNNALSENTANKTNIKDTKIYQCLFPFQRDAFYGIIDKIEKYNGCILADSVGLGKTFTALAVIKYYELLNMRVLVLTPKKLSESWKSFKQNAKNNPIAEDNLHYDVLNHTDLSRTRGKSGDINLSTINWSEYALVVIDESHNFRSGKITDFRVTRYQKLLEDVIKNGGKTRILMLSATPVNNNIKDLESQLRLITGDNDAAFADLSIPSLEKLRKSADRDFRKWSKLPEEERTIQSFIDLMDPNYFKLLDTMTIARSRRHVVEFYSDSIDKIGKFPERLEPKNITPENYFTGNNRDIDITALNNLILSLNMAIYAPLSYLRADAQNKPEYREYFERIGNTSFTVAGRERTTIKLILSMLLKRLESSAFSFRETIDSLSRKIENVLSKIKEYENKSRRGKQITNLDDLDDTFEDIGLDDEDVEEMLDDAEIAEMAIVLQQNKGKKVQINLADIDRLCWVPLLEQDLQTLERIGEQVKDCEPENDNKLHKLVDLIERKIDAGDPNPGNRKVIVFTAFADTASSIYEYLSQKFIKRGIYTGLVTGSSKKKGVRPTSNIQLPVSVQKILPANDFHSILTHFSPHSMGRNAIIDEENCPEIDILVATDCISEGQNLQDCDYLVNYDIHWNPVRIIQRFGRIDRIGSKNEKIQLVSFWPTADLEAYLDLSRRVKTRMELVNITGANEKGTVIDNKKSEETDEEANARDYRRKQLERLQKEVVDLEEIRGGISITDVTFNDYRADLIRLLNSRKDLLEHMPEGIFAVCPANEKGPAGSVLFILKSVESSLQNTPTANPLAPYIPIMVGPDGTPLCSYKNSRYILDLLRTTCAQYHTICESCIGNLKNSEATCKDFEPLGELLDAAIQHILGQDESETIDQLFKPEATRIGLNRHANADFEVMCYVVYR